jgi:4-hydroxy-tetrahydrodipicolinate synthase
MNNNFIGTGVALITPFHDDESVDFESLKNLVAHCINGGADYLVVNGTTGESPTLLREERSEVLSFVISETSGRIPVVYGIGGNNTADVVSKIGKTDFTNISGILSISPYYSKPSQEGIFQHYKKIAEVSPVPVILYNVPSRTGSNMTAATTIRLSQIEKIAGIKEAHGDLNQSLEISKRARPGFLLISGDDMLTVPMISIGGKGAISVLANAYPGQFGRMVNHALRYQFNEALEILKGFSSVNEFLYTEGNPVGIKYVLKLLGLSKENVRLPLMKASDELKKRIENAIREIK